MDRNRAARLAPALAIALASASLTASCSSVKIPFFGRDDNGEGQSEAPSPAELAEERRQAAIARAVVADGGEVSKVKYLHLRPGRMSLAADPAIPFEERYHLHGAVTAAERLERYGNYYEVFWKTENQGTPATVTLNYRQKSTGASTQAKSITVEDPNRRNVTKFNVTGDEYQAAGAVTAWRVTVEQGGKTIAATQSFLWD
jgi:hypothetical protein